MAASGFVNGTTFTDIPLEAVQEHSLKACWKIIKDML
jgi:hypothetical protein